MEGFSEKDKASKRTERFNKVFKHFGLKQKDFAEKIGTTQANISATLLGKRDIGGNIMNRLCVAFPDLSPEWLLTGKGEMIKGTETEPEYNGFYYPDVTASAGIESLITNENKIPVSIPNFENGLMYVNVKGDSMSPKYLGGDIIAIKEIDSKFITFGHAYIVVMENDDIHLKYIQKGKDEEHIVLRSENKNYEEREFHLSLFRKFFIVKGVISKSMI